MAEIELKINKDVPQYVCDSCRKCSSIFGQSLCTTQHRGCCWYSPKFTLYEIHKMVKSNEGLELLERIRNMDNIKIYNYYIHVKANFDEVSYKKYTKNHRYILNGDKVEDKRIFFKSCRFVKEGVGCTIPAEFRSHVCNLFICKEVTDELNGNKEFKNYLKERDNYVRWLTWEEDSLQMMFIEKDLNLIDNFDEIIDILKEMPLENYECIELKPIQGQVNLRRGA